MIRAIKLLLRTKLKDVRDIAVGDYVATNEGPRRVSEIRKMDKCDGPNFLIVGPGMRTAVPLVVKIGTKTRYLHPGQKIRIMRAAPRL